MESDTSLSSSASSALFFPSLEELHLEDMSGLRGWWKEEDVEPMDPWYKGFKGTIEKTRDSGFSYTVSGIIEEVDETTVRITELPIRRWTQDYKEFLESIMADMNSKAKENDKIKDRFIKDFRDYSTDTIAQFEVTMEKEKLFHVKQEGLLKKFKLTSTITTSNMHLFDKRGLIKKYENPEQILIEFFDERLEFYGKRKKFFLDNLEKDLLKLENKVRFILGVVNGEIRVSNRKRAELVNELRIKGFTPFPKKGKTAESAAVGADDESEEAEENSGETTEATNSREAQASDYDYLLSMAIGTLTYEKVQELCAEKDKVSQQLEELRMLSPESLWLKDLDALETALDEQDRCDAEKAADAMNEAAKKPTHKNNKKTNNVELVAETAKASAASLMETDDPPQAVKGRGGPRKAPGKKQQKSVVVEEDEEEEDMEPLRARLAAYNLDSSPENSAGMETDALEAPITKKEPSKREAAKKNPTTVEEISDDDQGENKVNDEDFEAEVVAVTEKKGRGSGTKTNVKTAAKTTAAAAKKRGPAGKQSQLGQKLITQILKPSETSGISPEKKVRKMRASPFNKKSGSVLGGDDEKADALDSIEEGTEVMPTRRRSQREAANRKPTTFVLSDSDESEEEEPTDDSDFDDEEDDE
ncbi:hypothetical protein Ancab_006584 [Ancistrocladus abbreviatus]